MGHSFANILVHIVFSTKNRHDWIVPSVEQELYRYLITICHLWACPALAIGVTENHVHILCRQERTVTTSKLVERIKTGSSLWLKTKGPQLAGFAWQHGYGAFSIGVSNLPALQRYIAAQKEHHKSTIFQDELRGLLRQYQIEYDERYLWD